MAAIRRIGVGGLIWFAVLCVAQTVGAQELDSARQAYLVIRNLMGHTNFDNIDTSANNEVIAALNAGLRKVASEIPFTVRDTVTVATETFAYDLNTNFMESGDMSSPYKVWRVTADGSAIYGLTRKPVDQFILPAGAESEYDILDSTIILNAAIDIGDKIYIEGRGDCTPVTHGGSSLNPIPKADRIAAVYWAVAVLAGARGNPDLATRYERAFAEHKAGRLGLVTTGAQ